LLIFCSLFVLSFNHFLFVIFNSINIISINITILTIIILIIIIIIITIINNINLIIIITIINIINLIIIIIMIINLLISNYFHFKFNPIFIFILFLQSIKISKSVITMFINIINHIVKSH
jgi:hypothetical protein